MKYLHKFIAVKIFSNGSCRGNTITFESDCSEYSSALLSVISHNKDYQNCAIIEPVTGSPVTFDITLKMQGNKYSYNSDQYFMTFNDLTNFCDTVESDKNVISILKQPFTRVLFSNAGKAGDIINRHFKTAFKAQSINTIFYKDLCFDDYQTGTFNEIKTGVFYKNNTVKNEGIEQ